MQRNLRNSSRVVRTAPPVKRREDSNKEAERMDTDTAECNFGRWLHHSKLVPGQVAAVQLVGTAECKVSEQVAAVRLAGNSECKVPGRVVEQLVLNMFQVLHLDRMDLEVRGFQGVQRVQKVPDFRAIRFYHLRP